MFREEFIDGNFYLFEYSENQDQDFYYFKFKQFVNDTSIECYYEIKVDCYNDVRCNVNYFHYDLDNTSIKYTPIDISLIIKYLPYNHPDKLKFLRKKNIGLLLNN